MLYQGGISVEGYVRVLPAIYLIFLSLTLTTALALLFSTFSTPALSAIFTLFLWIIGHFNYDLLEFGRLAKSETMQWIFKSLYYILPNFSNFKIVDSQNIIQSAAYFQPINPASIAWVTVYDLLYCSVLLIAAITIFSRRDFK
jgi:ABC-type transport system involved in multi-copper enzyme maturation permease subunit